MVEQGRLTGSQAEADAAIAHAAADWFLRVRDGDLSTEQLAAWVQWLERDDRHARAFDEIEAVWRGTAAIDTDASLWPSAPPLATDDFDGAETVAAWRQRTTSRSASDARSRVPGERRRWYLGLGLAASVAALATFGMPRLPGLRGMTEPERIVLETAFGENRTFELRDGSRVSVGGKSLLLVTFAASRRDVSLERGEAFFSVAKDRTRPFTVRAGHTDVIAVGTAFNVRRTGERVVVAVAEGVVEVAPGAANEGGVVASSRRTDAGATAQLRAGEKAIVEGGGSRMAQFSHVDATQVDGWRSGRLQYENEPLASVVADLSRYSLRRIAIDDSRVATLRVTGTVFEDQVDGWLATLQAALPVRAVEQDDGSVRLEGTGGR
jgi:transmembrane sensor